MRKLASICALGLAACCGLAMAQAQAPNQDRGNDTSEPTINVLQNPPEFDSHDPIQFLNMLKARRNKPGWMTIQAPVYGWVRPEHIPRLIPLLKSTEACRPVVMADASVLPESSTVGKEAAMMIAGYRDGRYPSVKTANDKRIGTPAELIAWWQKEQIKASSQRMP